MPKPLLAIALIGLAAAATAQTPPSPSTAPADSVSFDAWAAHARERMMALDTDHDGKISKAEFAARGPMMGHRRGGDAAGAGGQPDKADRPDRPGHDGARMFDRLDANRDGFLDAGEINAMLARRFARMDANRDGVLTPDERHAMHGPNAPEQ